MATINKDFKIKSGLIVEGTSGTINGYDILTKNTDSDNYIINLIGGETLVTSVSGNLSVVNGDLTINESGLATDLAGSRLYTDGSSLNVDGEGLFDDFVMNGMATGTDISTAISNAASNYDAAGSATTAENNAKGYADSLASNYDASGAASTAEQNAKNYADGLAGNYDAAGAAATAEGNANDYTDSAISTEVTNRNGVIDSAILTEVSNRNSAIATAKGEANDYTDTAVANLVDGAPALLDTLNELAAALQDNPDIISNLQDVASGKQDSFTAGTGLEFNVMGDILKVSDNTYDAYGAASTAQGNAEDYADTVAATAEQNAKNYAVGLASNYDAAGAAATAEGNANDYTDTAITNLNLGTTYDAIGAAATAEQNAKDYADALTTDDVAEGSSNLYLTEARVNDFLTTSTQTNISITEDINGHLVFVAENGVADSTTDDLAEGEANLYFTDARAQGAINDTVPNFAAVEIDLVAKQVAASTDAATAGIQVGYAFAKADYRSAEFLVKVAYGTHTEISKVLLTLDTSDNIAITEYGIVGTNGSASSISAGISGTDVQLLVTTANNNSTITVMGTLLK